MTSPLERDYVLGTADAEVTRLGLQHRVWRPRVLAAWQRAGLTVGQTVVDVGCGPGYASIDLAEIVGPGGHVVSLDRSRRFLDVCESSARLRGLTNMSTHEIDLDEPRWPPLAADLVWCRWIAAFVREPRAFVSKLAALLEPGGRLVMHEYLDYASWRLLPSSSPFERFVAAVMTAWRQAGGEPDIGRALPAWIEAEGLKVTALTPIVDVVSPDQFIWQWPRAFVEQGLARLVDLGTFTRADADATWQDFEAREATPGVRMVNPVVLEIVATK